jgi:hypothetical protein
MLSARVVLNRKKEKQSHQYNRGYLKNPKNWVPSASCPCNGNILRPRAPTYPVAETGQVKMDPKTTHYKRGAFLCW